MLCCCQLPVLRCVHADLEVTALLGVVSALGPLARSLCFHSVVMDSEHALVNVLFAPLGFSLLLTFQRLGVDIHYQWYVSPPPPTPPPR